MEKHELKWLTSASVRVRVRDNARVGARFQVTFWVKMSIRICPCDIFISETGLVLRAPPKVVVICGLLRLLT